MELYIYVNLRERVCREREKGGRETERRRTNYFKNVQLVYIHTRRGCCYNSPLTSAARAALLVDCNKGGKKDIRGHLGRDHPTPYNTTPLPRH